MTRLIKYWTEPKLSSNDPRISRSRVKKHLKVLRQSRRKNAFLAPFAFLSFITASISLYSIIRDILDIGISSVVLKLLNVYEELVRRNLSLAICFLSGLEIPAIISDILAFYLIFGIACRISLQNMLTMSNVIEDAIITSEMTVFERLRVRVAMALAAFKWTILWPSHYNQYTLLLRDVDTPNEKLDLIFSEELTFKAQAPKYVRRKYDLVLLSSLQLFKRNLLYVFLGVGLIQPPFHRTPKRFRYWP